MYDLLNVDYIKKKIIFETVHWHLRLPLNSHQSGTMDSRKKVQAMRLYPGSNLPISGVKFIKKQTFSLW